MISLIQHFEADQPQNPEFRNNPENFHTHKHIFQTSSYMVALS